MVNFNEQDWSLSNERRHYVNAMEENNIQSVGGPADLIYPGHQLARRWPLHLLIPGFGLLSRRYC